jgi:hypothetical protein
MEVCGGSAISHFGPKVEIENFNTQARSCQYNLGEASVLVWRLQFIYNHHYHHHRKTELFEP